MGTIHTQLSKKDQFLQAYDEHSEALFRYCYFKIADREMAKDLVQETYLRAWTYLERKGDVGNIRAFLYRILGNLIIDEYRKKKQSSLDELAESGFEPGTDETKDLENQLDGARAIGLIKDIPSVYGRTIFMRYVQELSLKEISEITGETENSIAVKSIAE